MAKELIIATWEDLLLLRKLILEDPVALRHWAIVVDYIVKSPADTLLISTMLERGQYDRAVLRSLEIWNGYGKDREDLVKVLKELKLNRLIDRLMNSPLASPSNIHHESATDSVITRQRRPELQSPLASPSGQHIQREGSTHTAQPAQRRKKWSIVLVLFTGASFCVLAAVVISFLPSTSHVLPPVTNPKPEFIKPEIRGHITEEGLKRFRDLVIQDSIALERWSLVTEHIVTSPSDDLRIKKLIRDGNYEEAVLFSLRVWNAAGDRRADLVQILRNRGLNLLADNILESISELS